MSLFHPTGGGGCHMRWAENSGAGVRLQRSDRTEVIGAVIVAALAEERETLVCDSKVVVDHSNKHHSSGGALSALHTGSASVVQLFGRPAVVETHTLWYFGHHCCLVVGFGALGIWHFWLFTLFHPFVPFAHIFSSFPPHPLFFSVN